MAIDFHAPSNAGTYASRSAPAGWGDAITQIADPRGLRVADIGCGGGIYSTALAGMGAAHVTGIDFSAQMIQDARKRAAALGVTNVTFEQGDATRTGFPDGSVDLVLQRALIHHLPSLTLALREVHRLLDDGGVLLIQDRTMADVLAPASAEHFRGWFFELFPRLVDVESQRRPDPHHVEQCLEEAGFSLVSRQQLAEERRTYADTDELRADLMARTGRSILHELDDHELAQLADRVCEQLNSRLGDSQLIREIDHWTVWKAIVSPAEGGSRWL